MFESHFYQLKDRDLCNSGLVISEGRYLTERLLTSGWEVLEIACTPAIFLEVQHLLRPQIQVSILTPEQLSQIAGFHFHRGILGCARRPQPLSLPQWLTQNPAAQRLLIAVDLTDPENLGSLYRSAAALGWDAVAFGPQSCDPFCRRSFKVSMGGILQLPSVLISTAAELSALKDAGWDLAAAVLHPQALPLRDYAPAPKTALLIGNEAHGLAPEWHNPCQGITIPMHSGADSLNAAVAGAIFMHNLSCK